MKTLVQILREFTGPFLAALAWTFYKYQSSHGAPSIFELLSVFAAAFFLCSWALSQWFRIRKHQEVNQSLAAIESSVKRTLLNLEERTSELLGHISGGDSVCYIAAGFDRSDSINAPLVTVVGKYPLFEVQAHVVDRQRLQSVFDSATREGRAPEREELLACERSIHLGTLVPGTPGAPPSSILSDVRFDAVAGDRRAFYITYFARNGRFSQHMIFRRVGDRWAHAYQVTRPDGSVAFESVDPQFPRTDRGVDWNEV